jgi:NAD(P)-dependent dehydrogenase (short-subunit alcohol dehydrogenase family)
MRGRALVARYGQWRTFHRKQGNLAVVTGANSGSVGTLARAGSEVILAARTEAKGHAAVELIRRQLPQAKVRMRRINFGDLQGRGHPGHSQLADLMFMSRRRSK